MPPSQDTYSSSNVLILTTDLPYFPGKLGHDYFNIRHLARTHTVGVVAPRYDSYPEESVANLEATIDQAYFWPYPANPPQGPIVGETPACLRSWVSRLPSKIRLWGFKRLLDIQNEPQDALGKLAILSNCAPQLFQAITDRCWHSIVMIQSSLEPWSKYLPAAGGKFVYFHDVRTDYLCRAKNLNGHNIVAPKEIKAIHWQEQQTINYSDVSGFVSTLDQTRAREFFSIPMETGVANIPIDINYFTPPPEGWNKTGDNIILFTGHLSHPPNVDAVLYFLKEIWPLILEQSPDTIFQVVGMLPAEDVILAVENAPRCELHANVPDIRPYFWNACVYVVPMRYGGGVRQKIFEAWSTGTPVICTTMAAEGTGAEYGIHCYLENSPQKFSARVVEFLRDKKCGESIAKNAKCYVDSTYSVSAVAPKFQYLVRRSIAIKKRKPFKVLFDLRWMELGHAGGIEQATYELISAISKIDYNNQYRVMAPRSACCEWSLPGEFQMKFFYSDNVEKELEAKRSLLINGLASSFGVSQLMNLSMRNLSLLHKLDFDLVHSVAGYTHPDMIGFPNILTINDLQHLHYPQFFTGEEYSEREKLYRASAERAEHIICISEFTRQDIHRLYGIPLEKMSTVWIIPSRNVWVKVSRSDTQSILSTLGLAAPFLFFPAHCWPHKNHARLVKAFANVLAQLPSGLKLVMTGRPFPEDHPAAVLINETKLKDRIVHLGYRSPLEIRVLFQECMALVFPSLFEGYGMPVAEAIIAGKPVLCSDVTSLPEIAGDAALTFDPDSIEAIGDALVQVATSEKLRSELSAAAVSRRHLFSARQHAIQTLSIYNRVYGRIYGDDQ